MISLLQRRRWHTDISTISELIADGVFQCFILEDTERLDQPKVPKLTAIPRGLYNVSITFSPRFNRDLPLVWNVETADGRKLVRSADGLVTFEGVRIHPGNRAPDTDGCLLPGRTRAVDFVGESVLAFDPLFAKLLAAKDPRTGRSATLEIVGPA